FVYVSSMEEALREMTSGKFDAAVFDAELEEEPAFTRDFYRQIFRIPRLCALTSGTVKEAARDLSEINQDSFERVEIFPRIYSRDDNREITAQRYVKVIADRLRPYFDMRLRELRPRKDPSWGQSEWVESLEEPDVTFDDEEPVLERVKVLYVDKGLDEKNPGYLNLSRELDRFFSRQLGVEVFYAKDPSSADIVLQKELPDVVICDMNLKSELESAEEIFYLARHYSKEKMKKVFLMGVSELVDMDIERMSDRVGAPIELLDKMRADMNKNPTRTLLSIRERNIGEFQAREKARDDIEIKRVITDPSKIKVLFVQDSKGVTDSAKDFFAKELGLALRNDRLLTGEEYVVVFTDSEWEALGFFKEG
ncbi:MAG TPA: hypothetical protein PKZ41_06415, partial [Candidatus Omnitrophota bacterium]|nr:hypothetical protein [Candidatus Omnitrophota bacterium]